MSRLTGARLGRRMMPMRGYWQYGFGGAAYGAATFASATEIAQG